MVKKASSSNPSRPAPAEAPLVWSRKDLVGLDELSPGEIVQEDDMWSVVDEESQDSGEDKD